MAKKEEKSLGIRFAIYDSGHTALQVLSENEEGEPVWVNVPEIRVTNESIEDDPNIGTLEKRVGKVRAKQLKDEAEQKAAEAEKD